MPSNATPSPFGFTFDPAMPLVKLVDKLIWKAAKSEASDIHIDPKKHGVRVRFRIDGVLHDVCTLPLLTYPEFVARVKIISGLRIDERILPQDGRLSIGDELDIRVTVIASYHGESIVMRLLKRSVKAQTLEDLGFSKKDRDIISQTLRARRGLILVTGPTGSGKTTTLYSLLAMVDDNSVSTVTIEDPVEYEMPHARQIQVHQKKGINFANGLRSILRQDPDVIMVGEIRDHETASMATSAALTGHLVLSTLHTNGAVAAVVRCVEMGIEPYLVAATLRLVIGQRLVRKLCLDCRQKADLESEERVVCEKISQFEFERSRISSVYVPRGCEKCNGTGFTGRTVVAEVLQITDELRQLISERRPLVRSLANIRTIEQDAVMKYVNGTTSFEEVMQILYA